MSKAQEIITMIYGFILISEQGVYAVQADTLYFDAYSGIKISEGGDKMRVRYIVQATDVCGYGTSEWSDDCVRCFDKSKSSAEIVMQMREDPDCVWF